MIKKRFLVPLVIGLSVLVLFCVDKIYFHDRVPFLCPIQFNTNVIPIRYDSFGDGHFGAKRENGRLHRGLDILAPVGTPVRAAKNGWAVTDEHPYGYGKLVKIAHSGSLTTVYAHLEEVSPVRRPAFPIVEWKKKPSNGVNLRWVKKVRQGDIIGTVGKSGNADHRLIKPHLHFEVRKRGVPQDPMRYLK